MIYVLHQTVWFWNNLLGFCSPNLWGDDDFIWHTSMFQKWERHFRCVASYDYFTSTKSGICDATKSAIASGESDRLHFCIFQGDLEGAKGWSLQQGAVGFEGTWDPWEWFTLRKINIEAENDSLEDDFAFPGMHSQVPAVNLPGCNLFTAWIFLTARKRHWKCTGPQKEAGSSSKRHFSGASC